MRSDDRKSRFNNSLDFIFMKTVMIFLISLLAARGDVWDEVYLRASEGFHTPEGIPVLAGGHPFQEGGRHCSGSNVVMALHEMLAFGKIDLTAVADGFSSKRMFVRYACIVLVARHLDPLSGGKIRDHGFAFFDDPLLERNRRAAEKTGKEILQYKDVSRIQAGLRKTIFWQPKNFVEGGLD